MLTVPDDRLERLIKVLSLAVVGEFDVALAELVTLNRDGFGVLEEALRVFLNEFALAQQDTTRTLAALRLANHELEEKLVTIEQQREAIRELSTPIIDVWQGILLLPLIGVLDTSRAVDVTETLLARVSDGDASWVLIDFTGMTLVDTMTAAHIIKLGTALRLLGTQCILTGISGRLAQTLVTLNISLDDLRPMRTLRDGLKYCLAQGYSPRGGALTR